MFTNSQMTTSPSSKSIAQTGEKIYQTSDYSIFSLVLGNRDINQAKVKMLAMEIRKNGLLLPILVNQKMNIIDGQHRFMACKMLGQPVSYFIRHNANLETAANVNVAGSNWSMHDWINKHAEDGNENYIYLRSWINKCKSCGVSARAAVSLAQNTTTKQSYYMHEDGVIRVYTGSKSQCKSKRLYSVGDAVKLGRWQPGDKELAAELLTQLVMFQEFPFSKKSSFVHAFMRVSRIKEFDMMVLLKQAKKHPNIFKNQAGVNGFIGMFEDVYNFGRSQRNRVAVRNNPQLIK